MPSSSPTPTSRPTQEEAEEPEGSEQGRYKHLRPFNSETAREAARVRWAKQRERESLSELDRLTAHARAGVVAARRLDGPTQDAILAAHVEKAKEGNVQSARFVMDWLLRLGSGQQDDSDVESIDPATMTPAQRQQLRARLLREAMADDESPANEDIP